VEKRELAEMLEADIITQSPSVQTSPIVLVEKKEGSLQHF